MSQVVYTITKENPSNPWILSQAPYAEACCTAEEMSSIVLPFREAVAALPGLTSKTVVEVSDTVLELTYVFDTDVNRDNCITYLREEQSGRRELMAAKRLAANLNFTMSGVTN